MIVSSLHLAVSKNYGAFLRLADSDDSCVFSCFVVLESFCSVDSGSLFISPYALTTLSGYFISLSALTILTATTFLISCYASPRCHPILSFLAVASPRRLRNTTSQEIS
ncbi:unnamed protein product [Arabis nemorensis]|uniref:Uncharacterized protein n=1 Tax=Arabis nemorensis TaxID=586526 RepID=A0A565BNY5_9BRAS|nr:unnamed protein product [Arabis nemorensis]